MANIIKTGTILIADDALIPQSLLLESEPYVYGWKLVKNLDTGDLNKIIREAGWNFHYIAGAVHAKAFGSDEKKTTTKALKQVIAKLKAKSFNCLEITQVTVKRSFGLPFVIVSAHSRHIQQEIALP